LPHRFIYLRFEANKRREMPKIWGKRAYRNGEEENMNTEGRGGVVSIVGSADPREEHERRYHEQAERHWREPGSVTLSFHFPIR
jgi:hypothetical protein